MYASHWYLTIILDTPPIALSDDGDELSDAPNRSSDQAFAANSARIISASCPFAIVADGVRACANARAVG